MSGVRALGPLAAGLAVAAYAAAWHAYGVYDLADEGLLLMQAWRAAHGQVAYVDFHTGYGPLYFRLQALLLEAGGVAGVRAGLAVVHGATAALAYALARRLAGPGTAALAVVLQVAVFLPVAPRLGAPFNVPYPAWYAGLAGVALVWLLERRDRPAALAAAGALAGAVSAVKPNSGLLLAAAGAAVVVLGARGTRVGPLGAVVLGLVLVGAAAIVLPPAPGVAAWVLLPPVAGLAALGLRSRPHAGRAGDRPLGGLLALGGGFAVVAGAAFASSLAALGPADFAREVLLIGAGVAEVYALPYPWPAAIAAAVGLVAFATGVRGGVVVAAAAATLAVAFAAGAGEGAGAASAVRRGVEAAALALVPLAAWGALARVRDGDEALLVPGAVLVLALVQLHPRPDFAHLMPLAGLLVPVALRLWWAAARRLALPTALVVGAPLGLALGRLLPTVALLDRLAAGGAVAVPIADTRFVIEAAGAAPLRALGEAVAVVQAESVPGDAVLGFPACAIVPFLAGRPPAGPHDYFHPGRPDRQEVARLAAGLAAAPPALAVTCAAPGALGRAWEAYPELAALLETRYAVVRERPPFTVRRRRE